MVRIDKGLCERIDDVRGNVPRARWVAELVESALVPGATIVPESHGMSRVVPDHPKITTARALTRPTTGKRPTPTEPPEEWQPSEYAPVWEFAHRSHPQAIAIWVCGAKGDTPPRNPKKGS